MVPDTGSWLGFDSCQTMIRKYRNPVMVAVIALLLVDTFFYNSKFTRGAYARLSAAAGDLVTLIGEAVEIDTGKQGET